MSKADGGPAFPIEGMSLIPGMAIVNATGMTLRDWFAGQALKGIIEHLSWVELIAMHMEEDGEDKREPTPQQEWAVKEGIAKAAYKLADAMLAERERHS